MPTYSRNDVIEIQEASYQRGLEANKEYIAKLETAVKASLAWLDQFGKHAPIAFGGEQELHDVLQAALSAQLGVESTECTECGCRLPDHFANCECQPA